MDPFRKVFLDQVQVVIEKEANKENLFELLKIASPSLKKLEVSQNKLRTKAYRALRLRIHPDKHPGNDTTVLYHNVADFYNECCEILDGSHQNNKKRKANPNSPSGRDFPKNFVITDKWKYLSLEKLKPEARKVDGESLLSHVLSQCYNARGAIAHGQPTGGLHTQESITRA